eukprot:g328.t1
MIAMDAACKTALQGNIHRSPPFSEVCEDPTESEQSEVAWEGPLGGSSRAWFRGVVDTALVLLRRLQGDAGTYAVGVSAALIPPETVGEGNDASMDRCLAQVCRLREPRWAKTQPPPLQRSKELLTVKWAEELSACELILVSVSKRMKSTLLGTEKEPFLPEPHRIRKLPFMMGKPTFEAIWEELEEGGDPTARDSKGRVAYYLCSSAGAREAFRRWRGQNEEAWEWEKAQRQLEEARVKCDKCQTPITAKPFSRLNYLYCSFDCSNQHRRDLQAEAALKRLG